VSLTAIAQAHEESPPNWRWALPLALMTTIAVGVASHCEEIEPSVELRVYPRVAAAPAEVKITVIVKDDRQRLICPAFVIEFGDGCRTVREESCDGLQLQRDRPVIYAPAIPLHKYRKGGEYEVIVRVVDFEEVLVARERVILSAAPGEN
jgi:hypothetical protein